MAACRMADDGCPSLVKPRIGRHCLENVATCETDVLKGSRPPDSMVADPPVLYVARDDSRRREGGAEVSGMRQVINGLPESAVDNEEQREGSHTVGKSNLSELTWITAVRDPQVERGWGPI